uniref:Epoxide hydrolase N-terminal domain-containing protein n=1 Tax=Timema monikensis TaxID=170555 RepID=A0A7R9HU63_9NEOP|nr:unnamed protein product [Timema monikensis]
MTNRMGVCRLLLIVSIGLTAIGIGFIYNKLTYVPPLPKLESTWWGPGQPHNVDKSIRPFKINVPKKELDDLNTRLQHVKLIPPLEGIGFQYGFNTDYLKKVVDFWRTKYNWREREAYLNSFPQFKTQVDGLDLHFLHVKPKQVPPSTRVLPLLLLHGWPGSVREFYEIIPLLTTPREGVNFVFEVVVPSLPGYGFSEGASKPGLGAVQVAVVFKDLMARLGFDKFYLQGGDWGGIIGANMATLFQENVAGFHTNICVGNFIERYAKLILASVWPTLIVDEEHVDKLFPVGKTFSWLLQESGYMHLQATKPDTVGLQNSPVGLAAYILEKFSSWTNSSWQTRSDGGLTEKFTLTNLLDNIMIYWVTDSITTSVRLYSESFNKAQMSLGVDSIPIKVPSACAMFPNEIAYTPESLLKSKYHNLVQFNDMARGGHFAAFEEPQLLANDIWSAVKLMQEQKPKIILFVSIGLAAIGISTLYNNLTHVPPLPKLESTWWGPGQPHNVDKSIRPFKIKLPKEELDDLNTRLQHVKLTPPLEGIGFQYGFNTDYLKKVVDFWRTKYNWREREAYLNSFPQFKTQVDGLDLHFLHVKPKQVPPSTRVLPLLLLHGWPGSVREFYEIIPLLTTPREGVNFVFEVVVPSLPGYGFSEGASKPGLGAVQVAVVFKDLMARLGFDQFYVQGGDWGGAIGTHMATLFEENVVGFHSNLCYTNLIQRFVYQALASFWPTLIVDEEHVDKLFPVGKVFSWLLKESGYMHLQATKPDTVGVGLQNSPVGLAAYILEKFSPWTNPAWETRPDGGLTEKFTLTNLLDNIMIYWITGSITTSARLYSESLNKAQISLGVEKIPTNVPTACALFPNDLLYSPPSFLTGKYLNLVQVNHIARGGHFAAFEEPQLLADDIWSAIQLMQEKNKLK